MCAQTARKNHRSISLPELAGVIFGKQSEGRRDYAAEPRQPGNAAVDMTRKY